MGYSAGGLLVTKRPEGEPGPGRPSLERHLPPAPWLGAGVLAAGIFLVSSAWSGEEPPPVEAVLAPGVSYSDGGNRVIYDAEYFSRFNVVTANDLLERVPGLEVLLDSDDSDRRGYGSVGEQILINGSRVSGKTNDVEAVLARVPARQVIRVEVIRGAVPGLDVRSQGRVVNVVLGRPERKGYGSWLVGARDSAYGQPGVEGELAYSGEAGALAYVLELAAGVRRNGDISQDYFFDPDDQPFERQNESSSERSEEIGFASNAFYSLLAGRRIGLNVLFDREDDSETETSRNFDLYEGDEADAGGRRRDGDQSATSGEVGADYRHTFFGGTVLTVLGIYTFEDVTENTRFYDLLPDGGIDFDKNQVEESSVAEQIARGVYEWEVGDGHQLEAGAELAFNRVEESAREFDGEDSSPGEAPGFEDSSEIEERRAEAFVRYNRELTETLALEGALDVEHSSITQRSEGWRRSRDFFFVKPRLVLTRNWSEQVQLRGRVEKTVSQLDFGDFVASFANDDNRDDIIIAGNPELVPEQAWEYELTYELQFPDDLGVIELRALYADVSDYIGRIALEIETPNGTEITTAPGNIGDGYLARFSFVGSVRLDGVGIDGGVLECGIERSRSRVRDPFTLEKRPFDSQPEYEWLLNFRQDLDWKHFSWGIETGKEAASFRYDRDYVQKSEEDMELDFFLEFQPWRNLTVRFKADNLLNGSEQRDRLQFEGDRSDSPLERREWRITESGRQVRLSIEGTF